MIAIAMTAERLYEECKEIVRATATAFAYKFGQDVDEMRADANTAFMKGYKAIMEGRHNSDDLKVEIRRWVWFELFDEYRTRTQHRREVKTVVENYEYIDQLPNNQKGAFVIEFFDGLSSDARTAAMLVLDPPADVAHTARAKGGSECNMRSTMRQHLRQQGWTTERITACFEEVAKALC